MKVETMMDGKGNMIGKTAKLEIKINGGEAGVRAARGLIAAINRLGEAKREIELNDMVSEVHGYAACCLVCGFVEEKGLDELMGLVSYIGAKELGRIREDDKKGRDGQ